MRTSVTTVKRTFDLKNITEEEGLILRTLLNLNDEGIKTRLIGDNLYWESALTLSEAMEIGRQLVKSILTMVDGYDVDEEG